MPAATLVAIGVGPVVLGGVLAALVLLAAVPSRAREAARVTCIFLVVLAPVIAIAYALSLVSRSEPLAWLALLPITIVWLAILDLRWGVSGRVTKGLPRNGTKRAAPKAPVEGGVGGGPSR